MKDAGSHELVQIGLVDSANQEASCIIDEQLKIAASEVVEASIFEVVVVLLHHIDGVVVALAEDLKGLQKEFEEGLKLHKRRLISLQRVKEELPEQ